MAKRVQQGFPFWHRALSARDRMAASPGNKGVADKSRDAAADSVFHIVDMLEFSKNSYQN